MAETNLYSNVYIRDLDTSNKIYMDIDPVPTYTLSPARRIQVSTPCLPGLSGSALTAGKTIHWDGGADITGGLVEFACSYMTSTTRTALKAKYDTLADVRFSPDNGVTEYRCQWAEDGFLPTRGPGRISYNLKIKMKIVSQY